MLTGSDIQRRFLQALDQDEGGPFDLILCPACPLPAFTHSSARTCAGRVLTDRKYSRQPLNVPTYKIAHNPVAVAIAFNGAIMPFHSVIVSASHPSPTGSAMHGNHRHGHVQH